MKVIISGGGTGGHIFPAIAIAKYLQSQYPECKILFVGALGKMEMQKVPAEGFDIIGLNIAGFQRKHLLKNLTLPFKMYSCSKKARKILKDFSPDVVIGVGGYASWATLSQAQKLGIPTLLQEQNSFAGKSNQILSKRAKVICTAYDNMQRFFPADKIVKTGNPVRKNISTLKDNLSSLRLQALEHYSLDGNKRSVLVLGGSLGAKTINDSIQSSLQFFLDNDIQLLWQTGKFYYQNILSSVDETILHHPNIRITEFIKDMPLAYSLADVIISRAGALSISELCQIAKPTILVPSPNVAEDHQRKNAMALTEKHAAIMILDKDLQTSLVPTLSSLLDDKDLQSTLSQNIFNLATFDSDRQIVEQAIKIIND